MTLQKPKQLKLDTVRSAVESAASWMEKSDLSFGHGTNNALDEAAYLVSVAINSSPVIPENKVNAVLTTEQKECIISYMEQRITQRIPAAYITHEAWFAGLHFYVDERVLVPRSPIAEIIESRFEPWIESQNVSSILDCCTGSACIAIACAMVFPLASVDASDISSDALHVATKNIKTHQLEQRVKIIKSDIFQNIGNKRYDIIVCNPPYVDSQDMKNLTAEFLAEPEMGLAAGEQGLDIVLPMLAQAEKYLTENGIIVIEVGNSAEALQNKFPSVPFMWFEFEFGGDGVFLLDANQIREYKDLFNTNV